MNLATRIKISGLSGALAVALGALGAHYLKSLVSAGELSQDALNSFETATRYHLAHSLAMLLASLPVWPQNNKQVIWAFRLFLVGIILFSGSIYLLSLRHILHADWLRVLGPVTPIGGICLISAWIAVAFSFAKKNQDA
ncbi:MAG TPA: DUF423 domain-containing protein [Bacteroidia bacterium]|nr:DUF423 domain-containing protein [Bacteroidia bacterium]